MSGPRRAFVGAAALGLLALVSCPLLLVSCRPPSSPLLAGFRDARATPAPAPVVPPPEIVSEPESLPPVEMPPVRRPDPGVPLIVTFPPPAVEPDTHPDQGDEGGLVPRPAAAAAPAASAEPSGGAVPLVALPPAPSLSERGRTLIYEFETGGRSGYDPHPEWPGAASGVTVGIGYDCGYNSREVILADWSMLPERDRQRLAACAGLTGAAARARIAGLRDITIPWATACAVFEQVTVTRFWQLCRRTWPGFLELRPTSRDSLLSLTFNRGSSMVGEKRRHMRNIRDLSPRADYSGMGQQEEAMVVVWAGTAIEKGMKRRRYAEAGLMRALP